MAEAPATTRDAISGGALHIQQSKDGFRFGLDAVLLATDLPPVGDDQTVVELGAGQGAVALAIATRCPTVSVVAYELQESLFDLLRANIDANDLTERVRAIRADIRDRDVLDPHTADLTVMNPPYHRVGHGRPCPDPERDAARFERNGSIGDFLAAAQYVTKPRGFLKLVLPPLRLPDLMAAVATTDFRPLSVRYVHSRADSDAYLMEWVFRRDAAPDLTVRPPLVVRDEDGYTEEVRTRIETAALDPP